MALIFSMVMAVVVGLLLLLAAFALWRLQSRRSRAIASGPKGKARGRKASHPYAAVRVEPVGEGCAAVGREAGKVWLSSQAPELPLADCDREHCRCHYVHLDDRRQSEDRRNPYVPIDASVYDAEKTERKGRGRRSDD